jgi:hypothetical protein
VYVKIAIHSYSFREGTKLIIARIAVTMVMISGSMMHSCLSPYESDNAVRQFHDYENYRDEENPNSSMPIK